MAELFTIGLDIAKSVYQVHSIDFAGAFVWRWQVCLAYWLLFFVKQPKFLIGIDDRLECAPVSGKIRF
jgi:transposase